MSRHIISHIAYGVTRATRFLMLYAETRPTAIWTGKNRRGRVKIWEDGWWADKKCIQPYRHSIDAEDDKRLCLTMVMQPGVGTWNGGEREREWVQST